MNSYSNSINQNNMNYNVEPTKLNESSKHISDKNAYPQPNTSVNGEFKLRRALSDTQQICNNAPNNIPKKQEEEKGFFSKMFGFLNPWKIEEEEYIDGHGFKCKRPKEKIPLRKKGDKDKNLIQKAGTESIGYASQHSGFGGLFL